jgi:hypothetical protein
MNSSQNTGMTGRHKCRNSYCPNLYDDVVGKQGWGGATHGAECIPCLYARQMIAQGQTPDQVEKVPHLMKAFSDLLAKTGWTWEQVREAHVRAKAARVQG